MLGGIHFRLPESTPKAFWWALLVLVVIAGALILFPEWREQLRQLALTPGSSKSAGSDLGFPKGCTPLTIQVPMQIYDESGVHLTFRRASAEDMQKCNPRGVLQSGKSNVIDIARRKNDEKSSVVTVRMPDAAAVIGVKDGNDGGYIEVLLCRPPELYAASWGTFVPSTPLQLTNRTSRLSAEARSALVAECGGR